MQSKTQNSYSFFSSVVDFKGHKVNVPCRGDMKVEFSSLLLDEKETNRLKDINDTVMKKPNTIINPMSCKEEAGKFNINHTYDNDDNTPSSAILVC